MYRMIGVVLGLLLSVGVCAADNEAYIPSDESLLGGFGGGIQPMVYYHPSLSKLNDHLKDNGFQPVKDMYGLGGTSRWSFNQNYSIGITGAGFWGTSDNINATATINEATIGGGYCMFLGAYRIPLGKWWAVNAGAGIGRISAGYELLITATADGGNVRLIRAGGSDWMGQVFVEGSYRIKGVFGIGFDAAYTVGKIDKIKRGGKIDNSLPEIDLSGMMIRVGPRFHF
ncbi:MAG: hypothetical protein QME49_04575 [bacterium]|nr:hypothetical protein [bacterium]